MSTIQNADDTETKRQLRRIRRRATATREAIETATDELDRLENALEDMDGSGEEEGSETEADQLAASVMTLDDVKMSHREQLSPAEHLEERYGVDASDAADEADLREQLADAGTRTEGEG
jgi:chromosome segregation ATPase